MTVGGWGGQAQLRVTTEQRGQTAHLRVCGEVDLMTAPAFERWLRSAESNGNAAISLDLGDVTFMDAGGLRALLRASERAVQSQRTFAIVESSACVRRLLCVTGATHLLAAAALALLQFPNQWDLHVRATTP